MTSTFVRSLEDVRQNAPSSWWIVPVVGTIEIIGSYGASHGQGDRSDLDLLGVALLLVGAVALGFRRTHPLATLAAVALSVDVYIGIGYPFGPVFVSLVIALFNAVQLAGRGRTSALAALAFAGFIAACLFEPTHDGPPLVVRVLIVGGWLGAVVAISDVVRSRREQNELYRRSIEEAALRQQGEQRLRIAQDLRDVLAHNISMINVQASVALHLLDQQPERVAPALRAIKTASHDALGELRAALDLLRNGDAVPYAPAPTVGDIETLVDSVRATGTNVELEMPPPPHEVAGNVQIALYRVVQESLTNVTRHAQATNVSIILRLKDSIEISVIDNGVGVPSGSMAEGNGTTGMRERVEALGGTLIVGPRPEGGFHVIATIPRGEA